MPVTHEVAGSSPVVPAILLKKSSIYYYSFLICKERLWYGHATERSWRKASQRAPRCDLCEPAPEGSIKFEQLVLNFELDEA